MKAYEQAIADLEKLGLKELEAYKDERFQANKKKMGLKFAHPKNK